MDEKTLLERGVEPLRELLGRLGGWPVLDNVWDGTNYNIWEQSIKMKNDEGIYPNHFAALEVKADAKNNSYRVLHFTSADLIVQKVAFVQFLV